MAAAKSNTQPTTQTNTIKATLQREQEQEVRRLQLKQRDLAAEYAEEEKVEVTISPMYAPHFGKNMPVVLNGIPIYVPCDGRAYKIPESYAMTVRARIRAVDDQIQRIRKLSDVRNNEESYAGQAQFISQA